MQANKKALTKRSKRTNQPLASLVFLTYTTKHYFKQPAHWVACPLAQRYITK